MICEDKDYSMREQNVVQPQEEHAVRRADMSGKVFSIFTMLEAGGFHTSSGMKYCMDDEEVYVEMLGEFVISSEERMETLRSCYQAEDTDGYRIAAHALKSAAKTIGADRLSALAKSLEDAAKAGDTAFIAAHHSDLIGSLKVSVAAILVAIGPNE